MWVLMLGLGLNLVEALKTKGRCIPSALCFCFAV